MSDPLIALRDVFCVHRTPEGDAAALQGASFEVARGEVVCVLGPSGAGKTTLLSVIAGRRIPEAGTVLVDGLDIARLPAGDRAQLRHRLVGFMDQRAGSVLSRDLPARQAIALPLALRGVGRPARTRRADELLAATGLSERARARPDELSGGERQRLALCVALAHRPGLLLADEPTAELDAVAAASVHAAIARLAAAQATTVVMVSHDPATAALAQRTVQMADGRLTAERGDGETALVIGRGGWLQLPEGMLAQAGIGDRVQVHARDGQVVLTRVLAPEPALTRRNGAAPRIGGAGPEAPLGAGAPVCIEVQRVSVCLGRGDARRRVLGGLSCSPPPGQLTVITGPSGSGKTTLLRVIAGLASMTGGEVALDGVQLGDLDREALAALRRRRIGYLTQDPVAVGFLSATETVVLALRWRGWSSGAAERRAALLLDRLGLRERSRQRVARLSAGEAQRVALARALAPAPGLILVDEPTSRLDRAHANAVAELLSDTAAREHQTIICASHDPDVAERAQHTIDLAPDRAPDAIDVLAQ
jgi:ABC-type lipoprotein export system ATPase subunit